MKLDLIFEPEAEIEFHKTREHYRNIDPELAKDFSADFRRVVEEVLDFPEAFPSVGGDVRRARMSRYPYLIYYSIDPDAIYIFAVSHQRKDQDYWRPRMRPS
jgi:toxin ParE1/3/4